MKNITVPANVTITIAPASASKVATVIAEKAAVAEVLRAVNVAYYAGVLS